MTQMLAMAVAEYSHAEDEPIAERLENWGRCYVDRMSRSRMLSVEGRYRSPQARHWSYDRTFGWLGVGTAPDVRPHLDVRDAEVINHGWQSIPDAYHQTILGGHYVRRWSPNKCSQIARKMAGMDERERVTDREFDRILDVAHGLLEMQLALPAVIRRARLVERVRSVLELDAWGAA